LQTNTKPAYAPDEMKPKRIITCFMIVILLNLLAFALPVYAGARGP
jgi:hypothetical protein